MRLVKRHLRGILKVELEVVGPVIWKETAFYSTSSCFVAVKVAGAEKQIPALHDVIPVLSPSHLLSVYSLMAHLPATPVEYCGDS